MDIYDFIIDLNDFLPLVAVKISTQFLCWKQNKTNVA
jgi:hypothetical protein